MKQLRPICLSLFLVLTLSITAFAGDISCPGAANGPQESPGITGDIGTPGMTGDMPNGITGEMAGPGVAGEIPYGGAGEIPFGIAGEISMPGLGFILAWLF